MADSPSRFGEFELRYVRDKQEREVDFLVVRDRQPWFLAEAKLADTRLSPSLAYFQGQTKAPHAFQVVMSLPYDPADCFKVYRPVGRPRLRGVEPAATGPNRGPAGQAWAGGVSLAFRALL